MAQNFKHKKYFKQHDNANSTYVTFSSVADAQTKLGFGACWDAGSPTKSYALEDANTLSVTFEFSNTADQTTHSNAILAAFEDMPTMFTGNTYTDVTGQIILEGRCVKAEHFDGDGNIENTSTHDF